MACALRRLLLPVLAAWAISSVAFAEDAKEPAGKRPGAQALRAEPPPPLAPLAPAQEAALEAILERLKSPDPGTVQGALAELEPWGRHAEKALPALLARLHDERYVLRNLAVKVLGNVGAPAISGLLDVIRGGDEAAAAAAGRALGRIGLEAAPTVPELIRLLGDERVSVDLAALDALSGLGPVAASAVPTLLRLSTVRNEGLSSLALGALANIDPANPAVIARFDAALRLGRCSPGMTALNGLLRAGRPGWDVLVAAVEKEGFAGLRAARSEFGPREGESDLRFVEFCCTLIDDGRAVLADIGRRSIADLSDPDAECAPIAVRRLLAGTATKDRLPWLRLLSRLGPKDLDPETLAPAVPRLREIATSTDAEAKTLAERILWSLEERTEPTPSPKPGHR